MTNINLIVTHYFSAEVIDKEHVGALTPVTPTKPL